MTLSVATARAGSFCPSSGSHPFFHLQLTSRLPTSSRPSRTPADSLAAPGFQWEPHQRPRLTPLITPPRPAPRRGRNAAPFSISHFNCPEIAGQCPLLSASPRSPGSLTARKPGHPGEARTGRRPTLQPPSAINAEITEWELGREGADGGRELDDCRQVYAI